MKPDAPTAEAGSFDEDWFLLAHERVGSPQPVAALDDVAKRIGCNAFDLWPPLTDEAMKFLLDGGYGLIVYLPGSPKMLERYNTEGRGPYFTPPSMDFIETEARKIRTLTAALGRKVWWDVMPEFDSSGHWWVDRPRPSGTRQEAYRQWRDFYLQLEPLGRYLRQTPEERGFNLLAICGLPTATHYAYGMGVEMTLLERHLESIGDLSTGICFLRGAARQYDRPWGIDLSNWRMASNSPTEYTEDMRLSAGWSASHTRRHLFISYMAGANVIRLEPLVLIAGDGRVTPSGEAVREFASFTKRHADRGRPHVFAALMLDLYHGFAPKCGKWQWSRTETVWRGSIPYSAGDHMVDNFLNVAFPEHWKSGTTPGAPWASFAEFRKMLAQGLDPRPYEPMGTTRWGDNLDVVLSNASVEALAHYRTIILLGDVRLEGELKDRLRGWVEQGGRLVVSLPQVDAGDAELLGFAPWGGQGEGSRSRWLLDGAVYEEPAYTYTMVEPMTARVLADTLQGDPLITRNKLGTGEVIVVTADHLQSTDCQQLLRIGTRLVDWLLARDALAEVKGPPVEYLVSLGPGKVIVTVVNNSGDTWHGSVVFPRPTGSYRAVEWVADEVVSHDETSREAVAAVSIPPYDLKIIALEATARRFPSWPAEG